MKFFLGLIILFIGLSLGSFLNAVIFRLKQKKSILGRSFCPFCKRKLKAKDLIPVLSFALLKGKCRYCQARISFQYPLVELITGLILAFLYFYFGFSFKFFFYSIISLFLIVIFVYDLRYMLIEDKVVLPAIVLSFLGNIYLKMPLKEIILGIILGGGFFAFQYFISRGKWIGKGDIRLGILMGSLLGFKKIILALVLAYWLGAFTGLILVLLKIKTLKSLIPFGPFLALASFLILVFGDVILKFLKEFYV